MLVRHIARAVLAAAVLLTSSLIAMPAPSAVASGGGIGTGCPVQGCYTYQVLRSYASCDSGNALTQIRNATSRRGTRTVGQAVGSTFTFSGSVSGTVGDSAKLTLTLGFSYSTSQTFTARVTHVLLPGETLRLSKDRIAYVVRQYRGGNGVSLTFVSDIVVYKPVGTCTVIF